MTGSAETLLALIAVLVAARLLGGLAVRFGQPRVGGEMVAGLVVGAALLSPWRSVDGGSAAVLGESTVSVIEALGQVGVVLYLFLVGFKLSPERLHHHGRRIVSITAPVLLAGLVLAPVALTYFSGPEWGLAGGAPGVLVMAAALSVNGFPMVARILEERRLLDSELGSTVLGAAAALTAIPFVLAAVAKPEIGASAPEAVALVLVLGGLVVLGVHPRLLARTGAPRLNGPAKAALSMIAVLAAAWVSLMLVGTGLLGGFAAGVAISRSASTRDLLTRVLSWPVTVIGVPVFLAAAGIHVDVSTFDAELLPAAAVFLAMLVTVAGAAGVAAARSRHIAAGQAAKIAALLNCRGLMLLALAVGLAESELIGPSLAVVLFAGALVTTLMTGPLLAREERRPTTGRASLDRVEAGWGG